MKMMNMRLKLTATIAIMSNDHDGGYRYLFSNPEMVRDLIMGFVPDDWLHYAVANADYDSTIFNILGSSVEIIKT